MKYAQYEVSTGIIEAMNSSHVQESNLIEGRAQIAVSEEIDIATYKIDLETLQPVLVEIQPIINPDFTL